MNRREFFQSEEVSQATAWLLEGRAPVARVGDPVLVRFGRRAMATSFEIIVPMGGAELAEAAQSGLDLIDRLEAQFTVYRDDSEVMAVNGRAYGEAVPVADNLFQLLEQARQLYEETGGAFDVAVGTLVKCWGFYRRQGRVPTVEERQEALSRAGMRHVVLDGTAHTVRYLRDGVEINLGSIGKGYAVDRTVQHLWKDWGLRTALVHGGHSSVFAVGSEPGTDRGWAIGLVDPRQPDRRLGQVRLKNRGLGTSAASQQFFVHEGRKLGHILDPRRGWPAQGTISATVTADSATRADALATAFYIQGVEWTHAYCEAHADVGAVLLSDAGILHVLGRARGEYTPSEG